MTNTTQSSIQTIKIIHVALFTSVVLFAIVAFFITPNKAFKFNFEDDFFALIVPIFVAIGVLVGNFLYKKQLSSIVKDEPLDEKIAQFQQAFILKLALLEGPSLFCIVAFMLDGNYFYLCIAAAIMLYFILIKPTADKITYDLDLNPEEKEELYK